MTPFKIILGLLAIILAWVVLFRVNIVFQFNKWMRDFVFNDQLILFSGRRLALLLFLLGAIALFSGIDNISDSSRPRPTQNEINRILINARYELTKGRFNHAVTRAKEILLVDQKNIEAWEIAAAAWHALGEEDKVQKAVQAIYGIDPDYELTESPLAKFVSRKRKKK